LDIHPVTLFSACAAPPPGPIARPARARAIGRIALFATALLAGLGAHPTMAQQATMPGIQDDSRLDPVPTVDRDRSDRTQPRLPVPATSPALPGSTVSVTAGPSQTNLTNVRFVGVSLSPATLLRVARPFIGKPITPENLQALATAVGQAYAASDIAYYAIMIPPQTPTNGVLTVKVTEGAITQYTLNGKPGGKATPRIAEQIARLMHEKPLHKSGLDRALTLIRGLPGETVTAQMRQIGTTGDLIMDVTSHRKIADVKVTIDNTAIANVIQAFQAQVDVGFNNVLHDGDRFHVSSYLPIHPDRYQFYTAGYSVPLTASGLSLGFNAAHLYTRSTDSSSVGKATLGGITLSLPLILSSKTNLSLTGALDGTDSSNYFLDSAFGSYRTRVARLGAAYSQADARNGFAISLVASHGLGALGAQAFAGFSQEGFTKINGQAVVVRSLGKSVTIKATTRVQYSTSLLPVIERAVLGGPDAGRAFDIGSLTGDKAVTGSIETSYTLPIKSKLLRGTAVYGFVDGALAGTVARPYYALPADNFSLASAGGGIRVRLREKWTGSVELAVPVKRPSTAYSNRARVFFGIGSTF
jgi:hemolysin activation/secretion protein